MVAGTNYGATIETDKGIVYAKVFKPLPYTGEKARVTEVETTPVINVGKKDNYDDDGSWNSHLSYGQHKPTQLAYLGGINSGLGSGYGSYGLGRLGKSKGLGIK